LGIGLRALPYFSQKQLAHAVKLVERAETAAEEDSAIENKSLRADLAETRAVD
jgi:hypothetical protein